MNLGKVFTLISYISKISLKKHIYFFTLLFLLFSTLNLFLPVLIQIILTGSNNILAGIGEPPKEIQYPLIDGGVAPLFWIAVDYPDYFKVTGIQTFGETYWVVLYDIYTLFLSMLSAFITSLVFTHIRFYSKNLKGRCAVEKGSTALGATLTTLGFSAIATTAMSCPSCGFTMIMTFAAVMVSATTGSLLGVSALYTALMNVLLVIGIMINMFIMIYIDIKIEKLVKLPT